MKKEKKTLRVCAPFTPLSMHTFSSKRTYYNDVSVSYDSKLSESYNKMNFVKQEKHGIKTECLGEHYGANMTTVQTVKQEPVEITIEETQKHASHDQPRAGHFGASMSTLDVQMVNQEPIEIKVESTQEHPCHDQQGCGDLNLDHDHISSQSATSNFECSTTKGTIDDMNLVNHSNVKEETLGEVDQFRDSVFAIKSEQLTIEIDNDMTAPKSFLKQEDLEHSNNELGNSNSFKCLHCDKCFKCLSHLKAHMIIHTGEEPFKCEHCEKCFGESSTLQKHIRTHTGERSLKCEYCEKSFSQS
ncbi:unnamed protein product, partial [Owenia fusiformis]